MLSQKRQSFTANFVFLKIIVLGPLLLSCCTCTARSIVHTKKNFFLALFFSARNVERQNIEIQNVERQNIKIQNVERQNFKFQNVERQNIEFQNVERQNIKIQNVEWQNIKIQIAEIQFIKMQIVDYKLYTLRFFLP
jgi:hypothetical protein